MTTYQKTLKLLVEENGDLWAEFTDIHTKFSEAPDKHRKKFNEVGEKFMEVVNKYNDELCRTSEGSGYGTYSGKLAEKFISVLRVIFPNIDEIGVY